MRLTAEIEGRGEVPPLPNDGNSVVAFMSFAVSRGFGAQHPLIALADRFHDNFQVRLGPITTFYEADIEDSEDREKLEMAWQEAELLVESLDRMAEIAATDEISIALTRRANTPDLTIELKAVADALRPAAANGSRVRLSYSL